MFSLNLAIALFPACALVKRRILVSAYTIPHIDLTIAIVTSFAGLRIALCSESCIRLSSRRFCCVSSRNWVGLKFSLNVDSTDPQGKSKELNDFFHGQAVFSWLYSLDNCRGLCLDNRATLQLLHNS